MDMVVYHLRDVTEVWAANDGLWQRKIRPLLATLNERGTIVPRSDWQRIVAVAFGRSLDTFQAVQLLCHPERQATFWVSGLVLTRSNFETFATLEWIAQDTEARVQLFLDEEVLSTAHFLRQVPEEHRDLVRPGSQGEIFRREAEVLQRHQCGPGRLRLLRSIEERLRSIADALAETYPDLVWEYEVYYRDVSGFAHPSAWGLMSFLEPQEGPIRLESPPDVGRRALVSNGEWLFRVLNRWNTVFEVLPAPTLTEWHTEWSAAIRDPRSGPTRRPECS